MERDSTALAIAQVVRAKREALDLSQEAFADEIDMHRTYYGSIERGERNMTMRILLKVCAGLGVKPSSVLKDAGF
ncbi:MAG: helix-turn-helix transcriptional regulator [Xanthomonadales bacterium]|nr:helix-turn-helix transcriptional regulator [Xanthomonadales bacterium]